jgi:hypothetical protein
MNDVLIDFGIREFLADACFLYAKKLAVMIVISLYRISN